MCIWEFGWEVSGFFNLNEVIIILNIWLDCFDFVDVDFNFMVDFDFVVFDGFELFFCCWMDDFLNCLMDFLFIDGCIVVFIVFNEYFYDLVIIEVLYCFFMFDD